MKLGRCLFIAYHQALREANGLVSKISGPGMTSSLQNLHCLTRYFQTSLRRMRLLASVLMRELHDDGLALRAKSLVYTSLLSLAPLLAVSFSILKGFGVHNQIEPLLAEFLSPLGDKGVEVTANIIAFVENIQVGVLGFVGFLMLFYTVVSLMQQIEDCFNHIWRVDRSRGLYRRFSDYLSVVLIGPVLLFSVIGMMASTRSLSIVQRLLALEPFGTAYQLAGVLLPFVMIVAAFSFTYAFIPNAPVKFWPAVIGGALAGLTWKIMGWLFGLFIANSAQYSAIYSGFALILLSMIWLYISWLILLLGGVLVFYLQFPRYLAYTQRRPRLSMHVQEQLALMLMVIIGRQHAQDGALCTLQRLADHVGLPWEPVVDVLDCLVRNGFLLKADDDLPVYVLAHDSDRIALQDILQAVRSEGDQPVIANDAITEAVPRLLQALSQQSRDYLQNQCLRDLIERPDLTEGRYSPCSLEKALPGSK